MADTFLEISQIVMSNCQNCPSRIACWMSRNSDRESLKTWKQITRNELLATMLNTTAVENAFNFGRNGGDCEFFRPCPLGAEQFSQIISNSPKLSKTVL
ncbi:unnamed protein product [Parnassius apollo]|uniref:(apollo) hypothetical protein n=1 Tax=Parnassius apollo TaxID=110799 RepID=A0A8S3X661_PARAO|nr:unnamed protein product [Parnassius apollo]